MPAFRPVVSPPPPPEPCMRVPPHTALQERERSPARAANLVGEVPVPIMNNGALIFTSDLPPANRGGVLPGLLCPVDGFPALPGRALLRRLL